MQYTTEMWVRIGLWGLASSIMLGPIAGCAPGAVDGPASQYIQRTDKVTLGAGNAQAVNAINNIIDPWPPRVGDRRIPANAERMASGIARYRAQSQQRSSAQSIQSPTGDSGATAPDASTSK